MHAFSIFTLGVLPLLTLPSVLALALPGPHDLPTPTINVPVRPFTVQAFFSPFPSGQSITGQHMDAKNGKFYLNISGPQTTCPSGKKGGPGKDTVLSVNSYGLAYLDVQVPGGQVVFIDPSDGHLGFSGPGGSKLPAGAVLVNFLHLGHGTTAYTQKNGFVTEAPGVFKWIGSENDAWVACPDPDGSYQIFKIMTAFFPDFSACITGVSLAAIDYTGPSPAAYEYV